MGVIVTVHAYVPAAGSAEALGVSASVPGAVPLVGTVSQLQPVEPSDTVYAVVWAEVSVTLCGFGTVPPTWYEKENEVWLTPMVPTAKVTGHIRRRPVPAAIPDRVQRDRCRCRCWREGRSDPR